MSEPENLQNERQSDSDPWLKNEHRAESEPGKKERVPSSDSYTLPAGIDVGGRCPRTWQGVAGGEDQLGAGETLHFPAGKRNKDDYLMSSFIAINFCEAHQLKYNSHIYL